MSDRLVAAQRDARAGALAARAALRPWLDSLHELEGWFAAEAKTVWADEPERRAREVLSLLQSTLNAMARGEEAIARTMPPPAAALAPSRIDVLTASAHPRRLRAGGSEPDRRRSAVLDLALWSALRRLAAAGVVRSRAEPTLAGLAPWLARPTPPAPGISPTPAYAATADARRFFGATVSGVIAALVSKKAGGDMAAFEAVMPAQPFDGGLPAIVAWSQAWSAAVAGVYLDNLRRHSGDDLQQALRDIWSGRLAAVRFRTGPGMTALPSRDGALHLDLWTCAVKAQALAFDPTVWAAQASGTKWHGVRVDMHELSRRAARLPAGARPSRTVQGLGVEAMYRTVFVDRLHEALSHAWVDVGTVGGADRAPQPRTITVELDRPSDGQLPNLRILLRWRDPSSGGTLRSGRAGSAGRASASPRALEPSMIGWRASPDEGPPAEGVAAEHRVLGDAALWDCIEPGAQWIDVALVARADGAWVELPVVLHDVLPEAGGSPRAALSLAAGTVLLPPLEVSVLRRAAREGAMRWSLHERGLGAFLMALIDIDAWRLARAS